MVGPALATERIFGTSSLTPTTSATLRMLAALQPSTLAVMHGSSFCGDVGRAFEDLTLGLEEIAAER